MNLRKNKMLVVGGAISLALVLLSGFLLFRYQSSCNKVTRELKEATDKLDRLNHRDPYPSQSNVVIAAKNKEVLSGYLVNVQEALQRDQIEPEQIEPAEFVALLERTVREVRASIGAAGTKIPERTSLAFDRYAQGELPAIEAIPRLVIQVKTIKALLGILISSKVDEILDVQRETFENARPDPGQEAQQDRRFTAATPSGSTATFQYLPPPEVNDLYSAERIVLSFRAREHAAWEVLNALARSKLFAVVNHAEILNDAVVVAGAAAAQNPAGAPASGEGAPALTIYKSHEERIVAGREPVRVDLAVDVYRFVVAPKPEASP